MTANTKLKGPEKWVALGETRKKAKKEMKKIQTTMAPRNLILNSANGSQYFVDKYPLIEKTREEWRNVLEKRNAIAQKLLRNTAR